MPIFCPICGDPYKLEGLYPCPICEGRGCVACKGIGKMCYYCAKNIREHKTKTDKDFSSSNDTDTPWWVSILLSAGLIGLYVLLYFLVCKGACR